MYSHRYVSIRLCPGLYLLVPKLTASRSTRSCAAKQMRCQVIVLAVRRNWRRFWPAAAAAAAAAASATVLLLPIVVAAADLYSAVPVLAALAVPVAQFLAAMTLRASFVRSLPIACRRHWGLVCGTNIVSKCRTRPLLGVLSPQSLSVPLIALRPRPRSLCLTGKVFRILCEMCLLFPGPSCSSAAPRPSFACQSQCQINRFIELIHQGSGGMGGLCSRISCLPPDPSDCPFTKLQLGFYVFCTFLCRSLIL